MSWIPSPNYDAGRPGPIRWVVWHSTEGAETYGSAAGVARGWFGIESSQVSAHIVVDPTGVSECVKPGDRAWHCGPTGNAYGYGVEIVGRADQSAAQWRDDYSRTSISNAAAWLRTHPDLSWIPRRFLTDDEIRSGATGHITHAQVARVLGGTTHTDPGSNFPFDLATAYLNGDADMNWNDKVIPDYAGGKVPPVLLGADVTLGWLAKNAADAASSAKDAAASAGSAAAVAAVISAKLDGLVIGTGPVDLDALAAKVADLLAERLAS